MKRGKEFQQAVKDAELMLKVFRGCIVTGTRPMTGSPCHQKVLEIISNLGRWRVTDADKFTGADTSKAADQWQAVQDFFIRHESPTVEAGVNPPHNVPATVKQ